MTYPCPFCRATADLATGCPGCGRGPDRDAAEVIRLDAEIPALSARLAQAREAVGVIDAQLRDAWDRRNAAAARVHAAVLSRVPAPAAGPTVPPGSPVLDGVKAIALRNPEASTRLVQNVLFLLGGLLLAVAAIVFTAVAWSQFGVGGRAALLAGFTGAALAVPPLALRRGLGATAETFTAVGLLLVLLDGYAAWYVNLFGVADGSALGYAGAVCAMTAAVAAGYEMITGLVGPRFAALLVAQPVLPLIVAPFDPAPTGWAFTLAAVAALDVAAVHLRRDRSTAAATALRIAGYAAGGCAVLGSGICALGGLVVASTAPAAAGAGAALITAALVLVGAAVLARSTPAQAVAGAGLVVAVAVAVTQVVGLTAGSYRFVLVTLAIAVIAAVVAGTARWLPAGVRPGPWIGALAVLAVPGLVAIGRTVDVAARTVSRPFLDAAPFAAAVPGAGRPDWQLPVVLLLLTAGLAVLLPARHRVATALTGAALVAAAVPASFGLTWWAAPIADLLVVTVALVLAVRAVTPRWAAAVAAVLAAHAVAAGFGRPGAATATLAAIVVLGIGTAVAARRTATAPLVLGGVALTVGLLAVPAVAWTGSLALGATGVWQSRVPLGAAALLVATLAVVARRWADHRPYALLAVLLVAATVPFWPAWSGDSTAIYASVALLLIAASYAIAVARPRWAAAAAAIPGLALAGTAAESVLTVLAAPYAWLADVWGGAPAGTGIDPAGVGRVLGTDAVAVAILAGAVGVAGAVRAGRSAVWFTAPIAEVAVPMALAAAGAPWPVVPVVSLVLGLAGALLVAVRRTGGPITAGVLPVAAVLIGAGLAGALATHAVTLVALAATGIAGAAAGAAGRTAAARIAGWLTAVAAGIGFAYTVGRAAGVSLAGTAFGVLAVSAAALALGALLTRRRPVEALAVQAAAQAGAVTALLLTAGSARYAAAVCTLWGVVLGVRALLPGESAGRRRALVVAAAVAELLGWWLLIGAERVSLTEAYTLPAAAVALLAGWLRTRTRPGLTSWSAYGPALAAALLPSLASVLAGEGEPVRRLLLGAGALGVVLIGARARLQAPVVAGGAVLIGVALHETVLVWDLLPRWIPLAAGGLLLVGLAMTLERRRRDLARVRAAVARLG